MSTLWMGSVRPREEARLLARPILQEYDAFHILTKIIFILDLGSDGNLAFEWDWRRALGL